MEPIALTRACELIHVTDTLENLGESPERMLGQAGLPMWHYSDPDDLIPKHHILTLMDHAARSLGMPNFGLQVGLHTSLSTLGSLGALAESAINVHDVIRTGCELIHLHNSGSRLFMVEAGDDVWLCHRESQLPEVGRHEKEQYVLVRLIDNVRLGAGPSWRPNRICLQTNKAPDREMCDALGHPDISIGQDVTAIAFSRALLAEPLRRNGAVREATASLESRFRQTAPATRPVDAFRQLARTMLQQGEPPRIEIMAEIAGLSVRSLQRKLADYGLSHFQIVDQARYEAATRLLEDTDDRITDIAMDLGYADSAHFTRAFRRWAGVTPREYRRYPLTPGDGQQAALH